MICKYSGSGLVPFRTLLSVIRIYGYLLFNRVPHGCSGWLNGSKKSGEIASTETNSSPLDIDGWFRWNVFFGMAGFFEAPEVSFRECLILDKFTLPETNSKSTWKWMLGIRSFPLGSRPIFRCKLLVTGRVPNQKGIVFHDWPMKCKKGTRNSKRFRDCEKNSWSNDPKLGGINTLPCDLPRRIRFGAKYWTKIEKWDLWTGWIQHYLLSPQLIIVCDLPGKYIIRLSGYIAT